MKFTKVSITYEKEKASDVEVKIIPLHLRPDVLERKSYEAVRNCQD